MTQAQHRYVTTAHADTCIGIPFWTLWEDMQVLLFQFAEEVLNNRGEEVDDYDLDGSILQVALIPIAKYVTEMKCARAKGELEWDERGPAHVREFMTVLQNDEYVPPIVVDIDHWMDGRHRMFAADKIGRTTLPGIDFNEWFNSLVKHQK